MPHTLNPDWLTNALTLDEYLELWKNNLQASMKGLSPQDRRYRFYARYNWDRRARTQTAYNPSSDFKASILSIDKPQVWMLITEDWCSDAAYSMPVFEAAAALNPNINLQIILRDDNLEVMDLYLTKGGRAIPKLVVFDEDGAELLQWGAKPEALYHLRESMKAAGKEGKEVLDATIAWYEQGGYNFAERELTSLIQEISPIPEG